MVLERLLPLAIFVACAPGCATTDPEQDRTTRNMDVINKAAEDLAERDRSKVVRSQSPLTLPVVPANPDEGSAKAVIPAKLDAPLTAPVTRIATTDDTQSPLLKAETQVEIAATIGTTPIYVREVREAVYQRSSELMKLPLHERKAKEREFFNQELRRIVERELILDEMLARLKSQKRTAQIEELEKMSYKDADTRMKDIQKQIQIPESEFKGFLGAQGITPEGLRRHFARGTMMNIFLSEVVKTKVKSISLADLQDYYDEHGDDYRTTDHVKWQDLFIRYDRFPNRAEAKKYAEQVLAQARKGGDFVKLVTKHDQGDSKLRNGEGFGEEKGKIFPPEVEPLVFSLKQEEVGIVEIDTGFHIVRIAERTYAGKRPFLEEKLQREIRRRVEGQIAEREYRRLVESLWRKAQPEILIEIEKQP